MSEGDLDLFVFGDGDAQQFITLAELCEILNGYSVDDIQIMIQENTFTKRTYTAITPYLTDRLKNEERNFTTE